MLVGGKMPNSLERLAARAGGIEEHGDMRPDATFYTCSYPY
jgi:hypothetical protein